jgi:hypothetical protein
VVKTLPHPTAGGFPKAFQIPAAVVASDVVLTGDIKHFPLTKAFEDLAQGVEFDGAGGMGEITGVKNHVRLPERAIDLVDRQLQGAVDVGVRRLIETDVAVADLNESEIRSLRLIFLRTEEVRTGHSSPERPHDRGAGPLHALQETAAIYGAVGLGVTWHWGV